MRLNQVRDMYVSNFIFVVSVADLVEEFSRTYDLVEHGIPVSDT